MIFHFKYHRLLHLACNVLLKSGWEKNISELIAEFDSMIEKQDGDVSCELLVAGVTFLLNLVNNLIRHTEFFGLLLSYCMFFLHFTPCFYLFFYLFC